MVIYIVVGRTGTYPEDSSTWLVCGYLSEKKAKTHARKAERASKAILKKYEGKYYEIGEEENPYDPNMQTIDGYACYEVQKIKFDENS